MGLDIGYTLYKKEPFDKENKLVDADLPEDSIYDRWSCGRCEVNDSWGELFKFEDTKTVVPVFQKGLADKVQKLEEYSDEYKLVDFAEFKRIVFEAVQQVYEDAAKAKSDIWKRINKRKKEIEELRDLQKDCSEDQEYAFNRWTEEINDLKEANESDEEYWDTYDEEDYDYAHAKKLEKLIRQMEEDLKEDKYYVIPYFSY